MKSWIFRTQMPLGSASPIKLGSAIKAFMASEKERELSIVTPVVSPSEEKFDLGANETGDGAAGTGGDDQYIAVAGFLAQEGPDQHAETDDEQIPPAADPADESADDRAQNSREGHENRAVHHDAY